VNIYSYRKNQFATIKCKAIHKMKMNNGQTYYLFVQVTNFLYIVLLNNKSFKLIIQVLSFRVT
jgi:hypothetical protein